MLFAVGPAAADTTAGRVPSLRRLRLNWAEPTVYELSLVLDPKLGAYDSVNSLALCAVDVLEEILPRFPNVVDLSLWLDRSTLYTRKDIQLSEICDWMDRLRKLEVVAVPEGFALKSLASKPSLHRLVLHGEFAHDVLAKIAKQINLGEIPEISLRNNTLQALKSGFIPMPCGPAAELSVSTCPSWMRLNSNYHLCTEDDSGLRRFFHSKYKRFDCEAIVNYPTIKANIGALYEVLPEALPRLSTLRISLSSLSSENINERGSRPRSCPALTHLELYVRPDTIVNQEVVVSGADIIKWITRHLQDFKQPLNALQVIGVQVESDRDALDNLARTVSFTPTSFFE